MSEKFIEPFISLSGNSSNAAHMLGRVKTNWIQQHSDKSDKAKGIKYLLSLDRYQVVALVHMKSHLDLLSIVLHFLYTLKLFKATFKNPILYQKPVFLNMALYTPDHRPVWIFPDTAMSLIETVLAVGMETTQRFWQEGKVHDHFKVKTQSRTLKGTLMNISA